MMKKKTYVKPHRRKNPKRGGQHIVKGYYRGIGNSKDNKVGGSGISRSEMFEAKKCLQDAEMLAADGNEEEAQVALEEAFPNIREWGELSNTRWAVDMADKIEQLSEGQYEDTDDLASQTYALAEALERYEWR